MTDLTNRHAVVIGASVAGLAAAAALAPTYPRITILERDGLPNAPEHRRGVPQSKHAHALQPGGLQALERLLPGIVADLEATGAPIADVCEFGNWTVGGNRLARGAAGVTGIGITRPVLEHVLRSRIAALPGVEIRDRVDVLRPVADAHGRVVGVKVAGDDDTNEQIDADLVVDAAGKASRLPTWLAELGHAEPAEESVHCKMAYLSRRWRLGAPLPGGEIVVLVTPAATPRFGVMVPQEDGTHIVTLGGLLNGAPERTDAAFLEFAHELGGGEIGAALMDATPVTDLQPAHFPASRRRRYDKLRTFPSGLLAIGDAIASFNPMYGQGMTVAILEAEALRDLLAGGPVDARAFFKRAHRIEDVAWKISTGGDLRYAEVEGKRTPDGKIMNRYLDRLTAAAVHDPVLAGQFLRVAGFLDPPTAFFRPSVLRRVFGRRRKGSRATVARPLTGATANPLGKSVN